MCIVMNINAIQFLSNMSRNDFDMVHLDWYRTMSSIGWIDLWVVEYGNVCKFVPGRVVGLSVAPAVVSSLG